MFRYSMPGRTREPLLQSELVLPEGSSPDMRFASRLISEMQRELSYRRRYILRIASKWLVAYDYVKMLEEENLTVADPLQPQVQFYRGTLSVVHGLGILLLAQLPNEDAERLPSMFGLTFSDLTACVEELGEIKRAMDSDMTPEMVAIMTRDLFDSGDLSKTS